MNIIFLGTPEFAVKSLQAIVNSHHKVVAVVSQPDSESGRGKKVKFTAVKECALKNNIPVYQFDKISKQGIDAVNSISADIIVTCAYGQILNEEILYMKKYGVINVHGSILPKYRGSSPIQWTIINRESVAGITILKSDIGIDDGPILKTKEVEISEETTSEDLYKILSEVGAETVVEVLNEIENDKAVYVKQDHENATKCKMLNKKMSQINFDDSANKIVGLINGLNIWPVVEVALSGQTLKLYQAKLYNVDAINNNGIKELSHYKNGEIVLSGIKTGLVIKASDGFVQILSLQKTNAKRMDWKSFLNGNKIETGSVINE